METASQIRYVTYYEKLKLRGLKYPEEVWARITEINITGEGAATVTTAATAATAATNPFFVCFKVCPRSGRATAPTSAWKSAWGGRRSRSSRTRCAKIK